VSDTVPDTVPDTVSDLVSDAVPDAVPDPGSDTLKKLQLTGRVGLAVIATFVAVSMTPAQAPYDVKANYVKREVFIPMRDGVKLFTIIYSPKTTTERYPMLMTRTAYGIGPYGPDAFRAVVGPNHEFAKEGYIFVYQDTRGKFKSEGEFVHHVPIVRGSSKPNESTDTWDTIDWLVKNVPNNNGRVGQ
jgi:predicted acyl esterase